MNFTTTINIPYCLYLYRQNIKVFNALRNEITQKMQKMKNSSEHMPFDPADYVDNPIALSRIKAGITQTELAKRLRVTQAYISKIERQEKVTAKLLKKVTRNLRQINILPQIYFFLDVLIIA